jgi:hypothetical protein
MGASSADPMAVSSAVHSAARLVALLAVLRAGPMAAGRVVRSAANSAAWMVE